jgi:proteasome lid subunit RPN8/RPN11
MSLPLRLSAELRTLLERWVLAGYPEETCGLLLGERSQEGSVIQRVMQAKNLNRERAQDRYELDPQDFLVADTQARALGLNVLGVWHSHPDHPARPSKTDREAAWPEWSYVILSVSRNGVQDIRSWRLNGNHEFDEEVIQP